MLQILPKHIIFSNNFFDFQKYVSSHQVIKNRVPVYCFYFDHETKSETKYVINALMYKIISNGVEFWNTWIFMSCKVGRPKCLCSFVNYAHENNSTG